MLQPVLEYSLYFTPNVLACDYDCVLWWVISHFCLLSCHQVVSVSVAAVWQPAFFCDYSSHLAADSAT